MQRAYNACTDQHNSKRRSLEPSWAFVSGVGESDTTCFWVWGRKSTDEAIVAALSNCQKEYSSCFSYSSSAGNSDWVQKISDNGGREEGGSGGGSNLTADDISNIGSIIGSFASMLNGGRGGSLGGGGGASRNVGSSGGRDCSQWLTLANQCANSYSNMGSLTGVNPGALSHGPTARTGQTGAFDACRRQYEAQYRQCMAMQ